MESINWWAVIVAAIVMFADRRRLVLAGALCQTLA